MFSAWIYCYNCDHSECWSCLTQPDNLILAKQRILGQTVHTKTHFSPLILRFGRGVWPKVNTENRPDTETIAEDHEPAVELRGAPWSGTCCVNSWFDLHGPWKDTGSMQPIWTQGKTDCDGFALELAEGLLHLIQTLKGASISDAEGYWPSVQIWCSALTFTLISK